MKLPNLFAKSIKQRVTRSPKACSKISWISETWYDHEDQSSSKAPWYSSVLEFLRPGWGCRFQHSHKSSIFLSFCVGSPNCSCLWLNCNSEQMGLDLLPFEESNHLPACFGFLPPMAVIFRPHTRPMNLQLTSRVKNDTWERPSHKAYTELYLHRVILPFLLLLDF